MKTEYQSVLKEFMDHRQPLQMLQGKLIDEQETKEPYSSVSITGSRATKGFVNFLRRIRDERPFDSVHMQQKAGRSRCTGCNATQKIDGKRCHVCKGNKLGMITSAGTGGAHDPPNITPEQAGQAIKNWEVGGGVYDKLPDSANPPTSSVDAPRNRARRPSIVNGRLQRRALRHDGQAAVNKRAGVGINAKYGPPVQNNMPPHQSLGGGLDPRQHYYYYAPSPTRKKVASGAEKRKRAVNQRDVAKKKAASKDRLYRLRGGRPRRLGSSPIESSPIESSPIESTHYLSKTIDEEFCNSLEGVLGL